MDLNVGLVVGEGACLVVDTRASERQGRELAEAVRTVTPAPVGGRQHALPLRPHLRQRRVPARRRSGATGAARRRSPSSGERMRELGSPDRYREAGDEPRRRGDRGHPDRPAGRAGRRRRHPDRRRPAGAAAPPRPRPHRQRPGRRSCRTRTCCWPATWSRRARRRSSANGFPLDWPATLDAMLELVTGAVVPGHGAVVDRAYVRAQRDELARLAEIAVRAHRGGSPGRGRRPRPALLRRLRRAGRRAGLRPAHSCSDLTSRNSSSP